MTPKNPAAVALGRRGGKARVQNQTAEQRTESARRAAKARWAKTQKLVSEITKGTKKLLRLAEKRERAVRARSRAK